MDIENKNTLDKKLISGINLFVGSGFSKYAESKGKILPLGSELKEELLEEFSDLPESLELPQLCTLAASKNKERLERFLRERFLVDCFDSAYKNLQFIELKNVFTTNIDNLFHKIFEDSDRKYINDASFHGAVFSEVSAINYYSLHGSVADPESDFIFGDLDIASAFSNEPSRWNYLKKIISEYPTVFWGYALRDAGTLQALSQVIKDNGLFQCWIVVNPKTMNEGEVEYYRSLGMNIIVSETKELLEYFGDFKEIGNNVVDYGKNPFPQYSVPGNSEVIHRAIQDFYKGAIPSWSDIYSSRVIRTKYFDSVIDALDGGGNVLITGEAATGKTTLLMQVASLYEFSGFKLVLRDLSVQKINYIINSVGDAPVMFFIDDCQSSLEALSVLAGKGKYRYVVAERDYAYLSSSNHAFFSNNMDVVDVTELSEQDATKIYNNIPEDIKGKPYTPVLDNHSLFEFIENNCKSSNIRDRFQSVVKYLESVDVKLVELFILICYMHRARSVASMDVLISYFSGQIDNYEEIYDLVNRLGSSVREYVGDLVDTDQDCFSIRSNMLAELIADLSPVRHLSNMLRKFHENVSRYCVPNYDAFKRSAYDARLFEKAFPNIEDGIELYDLIYKKHSSPFNLQQKALYLSHRKRHDKAFPVIDEAIAQSGSKNWSIKNSYAIIKFRANIDREDGEGVKEALDDSMLILEQCYGADSRKTFHVMTYADHALRYWRKYRDDEAYRYLVKAKKWLDDEKRNGKKVAKVQRILRECNRAIGNYD